MKKLNILLIFAIAMSMTFVSCKREPDEKPEITSCQFIAQEIDKSDNNLVTYSASILKTGGTYYISAGKIKYDSSSGQTSGNTYAGTATKTDYTFVCTNITEGDQTGKPIGSFEGTLKFVTNSDYSSCDVYLKNQKGEDVWTKLGMTKYN